MLRRTTVQRISAYEFGHPMMPSAFNRKVRPDNAKAEPWGPIQKTQLPNGLTIVSQDRRSTVASLGFYSETGAKFDGTVPGLSFVMRGAVVTSNLDESLFQIDKAFRAVGASYGNTEVNKRHIGWTSEVLREHFKIPLEKFAACLAVPRFAESDIERFRDTWDNNLEEQRWQDPREYCAHQIESVGFFKNPLGNPRHVQPQDNDRCSSEALLKHFCTHMAPQRLTLAAINVDHNELCTTVQNLPFQLSNSAPHFAQAQLEAPAMVDEAKQWQAMREDALVENRPGAMHTQPEMINDACYALGWLTHGADKSAKDYATALVCREVLNAMTEDSVRPDRKAVHWGTRTFYRPYSTAGMLGMTIRHPVTAKGRLQADVAAALTMLPAGKVTSNDVARATQRAAVAFHHDKLENQRDALDYIATASFPAEKVLSEICGVTADDCNAAFTGMKAAKPVAYSTGAVADMPSLRSMLSQYKLL